MEGARTTMVLTLAGLGALAIWLSRNRIGKAVDVVKAPLDTLTVAAETALGSSWPYPRGAQYKALFDAATAKYHLPAGLLARQGWQESRFRDDVISGAKVSSAGALGIMQIIPRWNPGVNPLDPPAAIDFAARKLLGLRNRFGTWQLALAAYNWGEGNLAPVAANRAAWPKETRDYVDNITSGVVLV